MGKCRVLGAGLVQGAPFQSTKLAHSAVVRLKGCKVSASPSTIIALVSLRASHSQCSPCSSCGLFVGALGFKLFEQVLAADQHGLPPLSAFSPFPEGNAGLLCMAALLCTLLWNWRTKRPGYFLGMYQWVWTSLVAGKLHLLFFR